MSKIATLMQQAAAGAVGELLAIEDVFSTYLYTGNSSTQTITNGIDLAGEGGLVWIKRRDTSNDHYLHDTLRGSNYGLISNETLGQVNFGSNALNAFNSDGFSVGDNSGWNGSGQSIASWTFRKAPRFFDVVTWTGDGAGSRSISHSLNSNPGCIIMKRTSSSMDWFVWHIGNGGGVGSALPSVFGLNSINAATYINTYGTMGNSSIFYPTNPGAAFNDLGATYVAYLFAHDPLGPSGDGSDGLIACGSYTSNSGGAINVDLGWEPQWLMVKNTAGRGAGWVILDTMRGFSWDAANNLQLLAHANYGELDVDEAGAPRPTPTGFSLAASTQYAEYNYGTDKIIYIAIRRGPMREPTVGTEVFAVDNYDAVAPYYDSTFPVDFAINKSTTGSNSRAYDRLRGGAVRLAMDTTSGEAASTESFDFMNGWNGVASASYYSWMFRRAPSFFDVVAYTGDGVAGRTVPHNLGVAPEMMWVKRRNGNGNWGAYHTATGPTKVLIPNTTAAASTNSLYWNNTDPTAGGFIINTALNTSSYTYIAYLFATLPGISKVGSYTGNGTSQTINCGFTGGARFVLIKRTDSTGDWYVWDSARGIVAGNDPHLSLNTAVAEVTTDDSVDAESSGFIVNQDAATDVNVSSASYIFYAVA